MNDSDRKAEVNYPLLLAVILIIGVATGVVIMKISGGHSDMKVVTVKMSGEQLSEFAAHVEKMVARYTVRMDEKGLPVVHPPAGSEVYILARSYDFGKFTLELEKGKSYRLKLASEDIKHSIIVHGLKLRNRINAGEISAIEFRPEKAGTFSVVCGEQCGIGHGSMVGRLIVTE